MDQYGEITVLIGFLVDILLLSGTKRLTGQPVGPVIVLLGAALGAVYTALQTVWGFRFLDSMLWRLVNLVTVALVCFGVSEDGFKCCGVFLLLHLAVSGAAVHCTTGDLLGLAAAGGLVWLLCRLAFSGGARHMELEICHGGERIRLTALHDTGNGLLDPISGERVVVIDAWAAQKLTGLSRRQLRMPVQNVGALPGLRLIPYRTVGSGIQMMLAMRFPDVRMGNRRGSAVVAFAPEEFEQSGAFRALVGGMAV